MIRARRVGVALVAAALLLTAACSSDKDKPAGEGGEPSAGIASYVALGDSYVSGPGIATVDPDSKGCQRSNHNWPTLLAEDLGVESFRDVSCGGATTDDIITVRPAASRVQPFAQIDAVKPDTELVTLGIGGNDEALFGGIVFACHAGMNIGEKVCDTFIDTTMDEILKRTETRIANVIERIRAKAPRARVILVGYLRVLSDDTSCVVPGMRTNSAAVSGEQALDSMQKAGAERAGAEYVSVRELSAGHEACTSDAAWVNGFTADPGDGVYLHPTAAGMRAVAKAVERRVRD
ncbi:MAG: SGNH/GDSL hydrolase family protein [Aeromicrobium sp.]